MVWTSAEIACMFYFTQIYKVALIVTPCNPLTEHSVTKAAKEIPTFGNTGIVLSVAHVLR